MTVEEFRDVVALWHADADTGGDVVMAACALVLAGVDGPAISALAGASLKHVREEVPPLLEDALGELGLDHHDAVGWRTEALRLMARRTVAGRMSPRELAGWAHGKFGHHLPEAEELAQLDDLYDTLEYQDLTAADVDQQVLAEARRLTA